MQWNRYRTTTAELLHSKLINRIVSSLLITVDLPYTSHLSTNLSKLLSWNSFTIGYFITLFSLRGTPFSEKKYTKTCGAPIIGLTWQAMYLRRSSSAKAASVWETIIATRRRRNISRNRPARSRCHGYNRTLSNKIARVFICIRSNWSILRVGMHHIYVRKNMRAISNHIYRSHERFFRALAYLLTEKGPQIVIRLGTF